MDGRNDNLGDVLIRFVSFSRYLPKTPGIFCRKTKGFPRPGVWPLRRGLWTVEVQNWVPI